VAREQPHQRSDLARRPLPVVGGEGVHGEGGDTLIGRGLDHPAHGRGAGAMARDAGQAAA